MLGSLGRIGGRAGSGSAPVAGNRLIQPGAIASSSLVTFSRSQVSSFSTATNTTGSLIEYAADVPRFNGAAQRLLLEGQRTNGVRNPRCLGASAPSTFPTNWSSTALSGVANEVVGTGIESGIEYVDIRIYGTPTGTNANNITFEASGVIVTSLGQVWSQAFFCRLIAGSVAGATVRLETFFTGGGQQTFIFTPTSAPLATQRISSTATAPAGSTSTRPALRVSYTNAVPIDLTLRVGWPTQELGAFPSTVILPPTSTTGASTRGQDNLTSTFAALFPNGVGTVLASFMLPQNAASVDQVLFEINDGTSNNRIRIRNTNGNANLYATRTIGGASVDTPLLGTFSAGTLFRVGLTFDGSNVVANFNGGTNQTVAGVPTGLTTLRVGNNGSGSGPIFGECGYFDALPYVIPGANLPAAVAAIP